MTKIKFPKKSIRQYFAVAARDARNFKKLSCWFKNTLREFST
jgi:hypothetical protein